MIVRNTSNIAIPKKYLFNAGAALFGVGLLVLIARETFVPETIKTCAQRYQHAGVLGWRNSNNEPLSAADLQAKLNGYDWGVLDNVDFVENSNIPLGVVMQVSLPRETANRPNPKKPSGVGFFWMPSWFKTANSACLKYSFRAPKGFKFGAGGSLPGFFGGGEDAHLVATQKRSAAFTSRLHWRDNGKFEARVKSPTQPQGLGIAIDPLNTILEPGQWHTVEQELVLNDLGKENGVLRVWVNGELKAQKKNLVFRSKPNDGLKGVLAYVHHSTRELFWSPSPKTSKIEFSPFFVHWR